MTATRSSRRAKPQNQDRLQDTFHPPARTKRNGRTLPPATALELDDMWGQITQPGINMRSLSDQWIGEYHVSPLCALLGLVNMIVKASGCAQQLNEAQFEDQEAVTDHLEELQSHLGSELYPLASKKRADKNACTAFFNFFTAMIDSDDEAIWSRDATLQVLVQWLIPMSSSTFRSFRHTATALALHICTCLCRILKAQNIAGHPDTNDRIALARDIHTQLLNGVFVHRYRDVFPQIRRECLQALENWIERAPNDFLDPVHLRYFGWMMNDPDWNVRLTVMTSLSHIFEQSHLVQGMRLFSERFKPRILEMAYREPDHRVQEACIDVTGHVYALGVFEQDEIDSLIRLIFVQHIYKSHSILSVLETIIVEETRGMDWVSFMDWFTSIIEGLPTKPTSQPQFGSLVQHFVKHLSLPVFSDTQTLLALSRGGDSSPSDEQIMKLLFFLTAITEKGLIQQHLEVDSDFFNTIPYWLPNLVLHFKSEEVHLALLARILRASMSQPPPQKVTSAHKQTKRSINQNPWLLSSALTSSLNEILSIFQQAVMRSNSDEFRGAIVNMLHSIIQSTPELASLGQTYVDEILHFCHSDPSPAGLAKIFAHSFKLVDLPLNSSDITLSYLEARFLQAIWKAKMIIHSLNTVQSQKTTIASSTGHSAHPEADELSDLDSGDELEVAANKFDMFQISQPNRIELDICNLDDKFVNDCVQFLSQPVAVSEIERLGAFKLLCEFSILFHVQLSDDVATVLENIIESHVAPLLISGLEPRNSHSLAFETELARVLVQFSKLFTMSSPIFQLIRLDFMAAYLQFFQCPFGQAVLLHTINCTSRALIRHLFEAFESAPVNEIVLASLIRSLERWPSPDHNEFLHNHTIDNSTLPCIKLAHEIALQYLKHPEHQAHQVLEDGILWVLEHFNEEGMQANPPPESVRTEAFVLALCELSPCITISTAHELHNKFCEYSILAPLMSSLRIKFAKAASTQKILGPSSPLSTHTPPEHKRPRLMESSEKSKLTLDTEDFAPSPIKRMLKIT